MFNLFLLLILFQIKHLFVDYFFQISWMLGKFKPDWGFFFPLLAHAGLHGATTTVICLAWNPSLWWLGLVDMIIHFVMDRIKAGPRYLGRFKALSGNEMKCIIKNMQPFLNERDEIDTSIKNKYEKQIRHNTYFWWSLGLDQMVHHITHYAIILILLFGDKIF